MFRSVFLYRGMEEEIGSTLYWCYNCFKVVHSVMEVEVIRCSLCQGIYMDQMDSLRCDHHQQHHQSEVALSGDLRYLTRLHVFGKEEQLDEFHQSDSSQSKTVEDKIKASLKLIPFLEEHVLIQFWSPHAFGKHRLLTTVDQPYGLGAEDPRLHIYRKDSESHTYVIYEDNEEEYLSPPARVFRRGLPEWTPDLSNCSTKYFPQQDCAVLCSFRGYLALPLFDSDSNSSTDSCVGVLELLTSSSRTSYAFEVEQVRMALKKENLRSPKVFDFPTSKVPNESGQNELNKIFGILESVSDIHNSPLAQTWAIFPTSSFVTHENVIEKSCSSFSTRCIGKVCMSTTSLPFCVRDLDVWQFREACKGQHLDTSEGFVGKALLAHGSCYCQDVTELSEEEYPLVHYARLSGLTSCFTIFLHSIESNCNFVLEFFLPRVMNYGRDVIHLVQTLKQRIEVACDFELGDTSSIQVVGPHTSVSVNLEPCSISTSSNVMADNFMLKISSSDSESISSMAETCDSFTDAAEMSIARKQGKKRKIDSETVQLVSGMMQVMVTFKEFVTNFQFPIPMVHSDLESEVAKRFNLEGKELKLKYTDDENDMICICCDDDLTLALTAVTNNTINLICELGSICDD